MIAADSPGVPHARPRATSFEELAVQSDAEMDVALGAALIAKDVYGSLDVTALLAKFDAIALPPQTGRLTAVENAARLMKHLYGELGFRGNEEAYYDPKNSLLPDVLDRRTGIPISLALVYCEVARRAGIDASGVGFPGHFLVRIERSAAAGEEPGALLVDPFFGGKVLDQEALQKLLRRAAGPNEALRPEYLAAASPRAILVRMLANLKSIYVSRGDHARAHLALDRVVSLTPDSSAALRERGSIAAKLGAVEAARADLTRVLELDPAAEDAKAIRTQLAALSAKPLN